MTNQSDRQADARSSTGTTLTYEGDSLAYFDQQAVPAGDYNGRLLAWINQALGTSYTEINGAKTALAISGGAPTWDGLALLGTAGPPNFMSFSEDVTKFNFLTGGTGAAIPHVFSNGSTITVATKQQVPDIPGGEVGTGFTTTGMCQDPDSTDIWVGNFGNSRGSGGTSTPISIVRLSADGSTLVSQAAAAEAVGGLQGVAFVTSSSPSLRCLAYVDGSSSKICFVNRDGSVPRAALPTSFVPNALTWDDTRQALWVGDANSGDVWLMTLAGAVIGAADFNSWGGPLDHLCVDTSRGTAGYLWSTSGANGSPGILIAWDIAKDQIVDRWLLSDAKAVEGIIATATTVKVVTDGKYHESGSPPNTVAPYNVNEFQTYTIPAITQWRYARVFKSGEVTGPAVAGGRRPYHLILDRGDGDTSADFCIVTRDADASINGLVANMAWSGKPFDPAGTANLGFRLLNGTMANKAFTGSSYTRATFSATFASGANNTQLGTRGTFTPDRAVNVVGTALAVNLGSAALPYKPRLGA
ncbi:hypothetical protein JEY40_24580 [Bradyrhizobium japonicum]|uniref:hypothetical protein n=1 Tax=Bradyrhizobium japonicum TaxID=375 RepID=UPI00200FEEE2|nr:hypothetical protein [Bradyrhizobium japonicum]UQD69195.1 hypothetical protein JEY40_24580 [Bradyrhizobium japonicum]WAX24457.1 hypothetical protein [Bradyrhizobium phage ppBjS10J-1]